MFYSVTVLEASQDGLKGTIRRITAESERKYDSMEKELNSRLSNLSTDNEKLSQRYSELSARFSQNAEELAENKNNNSTLCQLINDLKAEVCQGQTEIRLSREQNEINVRKSHIHPNQECNVQFVKGILDRRFFCA